MVDPKHDRGHSRFSPSASSRWIWCPGSIPFVESLKLPPWSNSAARLGTVAHSLLELCLKSTQTRSPHVYVGRKITQDGEVFVVDKAMANAVEMAIDHIAPQFRIAENYGVEDQLDIPTTGEWGTMDAWAVTHEIDEWVIDVWDYKNGRHAVEAKKNTQLRLYADGVYDHVELSMGRQLKGDVKLRLHIIQPNAYRGLEGGLDTWETTVKENIDFLSTYAVPAVKAVKEGKAKRVPGAHCKNCPGAARCPELATAVARTARMDWASEIKR